MLISKKKALNIRLPLLEHLNRTALSKDETALLLRLLEQCSQLLSFHYHFELKQLQPHAILRTDQSSYRLMERRPPRQHVVPIAEKTDSSQQGLELLFSPLLEEYYNPAYSHAEDNNDDQAPNASFQEDEFINPYWYISSTKKLVSLSSHQATLIIPMVHYISNHKVMITYGQEIIHLNKFVEIPTMPYKQDDSCHNPKMLYVRALTSEFVEPKNIKEAMQNSAWIKSKRRMNFISSTD
ncbi:hypothetical protein Tco_0522974 [Tanacetum coccineum]